jgi:hypothetical protein
MFESATTLLRIENMPESDAERALHGLSADEFLDLLEKATPAQLEAFAQLGRQTKVNQAALIPRWAQGVLAAPKHHANIWSVVSWWERRRPVYNLLVGLCGLPTLAVMGLGLHAPFHLLVSGTLLYAFAANACYTLGASAETLALFLWKEKAAHLGPVLLTLGTTFSVLLTLGVAFLLLCCLIAL